VRPVRLIGRMRAMKYNRPPAVTLLSATRN
jgi:hypothetical protein